MHRGSPGRPKQGRRSPVVIDSRTQIFLSVSFRSANAGRSPPSENHAFSNSLGSTAPLCAPRVGRAVRERYHPQHLPFVFVFRRFPPLSSSLFIHTPSSASPHAATASFIFISLLQIFIQGTAKRALAKNRASVVFAAGRSGPLSLPLVQKPPLSLFPTNPAHSA